MAEAFKLGINSVALFPVIPEHQKDAKPVALAYLLTYLVTSLEPAQV